MPLYDFTCAAGHTTEHRVLSAVDSVVCACGEAAQRERVFRIAGQVGRPQGTPIAHFSEAAQEARHRHDSTDDPAARAATRPDVWRPALKRAEVKQYDRYFGVSDETRWTDPRPKQTEQMRKRRSVSNTSHVATHPVRGGRKEGKPRNGRQLRTSRHRGTVKEHGLRHPTDADGRASVTAPWLFSLSLEGLVFSSQFGAANLEDTDVGTFGAGGVDLTEFDMLMTMPTAIGLTVIPVYWKPVLEAIGTIAAVDVLLVAGSGGVIGANSVTNTLVNTNMGSSNTTACTIASVADAGGTGITISSYIYREGGTHLTGVAGTGQSLMPEWSVQKTGVLHVLQGASKQVAGFASGQASTGFMHYMQVEIPTTTI